MQFILNGNLTEADFDTRTSLLDLLRDHLGLPGSKKGCNQGACGACTVLVDGERILSCLALAVQYQGRAITTIEGLACDGALHPLQQAFIEHDGFQCGYCTPGQICSAVGMAQEVRRGLPSNVTRDLLVESIDLSSKEHAQDGLGVKRPARMSAGVPFRLAARSRALCAFDELRERMSGNLCRCGAYNGIVNAIAEIYAEIPK